MLGVKTHLTFRLQNTIRGFGGPSMIRINPISYRCTHACPMCWRQQLTAAQRKMRLREQQEELSVDQYVAFIRSIPKSTKIVEIVGGGEPLLYRGIDTICTAIKSEHLYGSLITNGSELTQQRIAMLVATRWDEIRISFHAATRGTYRTIHGVDDFRKVAHTIRAIRSKRSAQTPKVILHFVLQHENVHEIVAFARFAVHAGVDEIHFERLISYPKISNMQLTKDDVQDTIGALSQIDKEGQIPNNCAALVKLLSHPKETTLLPHEGHTYCAVAQQELHISAVGVVRPCCFFKVHEAGCHAIQKGRIADIWWAMRDIRENLRKGHYYSVCKTCTYKQVRIPFTS